MITDIRTPFIPVRQLLAESAPHQLVRNRLKTSAGTAHAIGFHLYIDIRLTLSLAAAEDLTVARQYLGILATYADIGSAAAKISGAELLEVQGERLHFLVEAENLQPTMGDWGRLLALAQAVVAVAYERIAPKAGEAWRGCAAAADYGPAILLTSLCGGGSVVSLSPAANRPAKRLSQVPTVAAGYLAAPARIVPPELRGSRGEWIELDLQSPSTAVLELLPDDWRDALRRAEVELGRSRSPLTLNHAGDEFFATYGVGHASTPVQIQGFCFRADLDGFSRQVQAAFDAGGEAVTALADRFRTLLEFPEAFAARFGGRTIPLPWAGDCANVLIAPASGETFGQARMYLPVKSALSWHESFGGDRRYREAVGASSWSLGIAAGDDAEGNSGRMLLAELGTAGRTFRVVAGWAARRSLDAQQYEGVAGGDTVVTRIDRDHLWVNHAKHFSDLGSEFARARAKDLKNAASNRTAAAAVSTPRISSIPAVFVPAPRPYHERDAIS